MARPSKATAAKHRGASGETRRRMTEALREILKTRPVAEIRAQQISAAVGMSQPNFYNHFANLQEALLACAELSWTSYPQIGHLVGEEMGLAGARKVARQLIEFWREHATTLAWGYSVEIGATMADYVAMREAGQRDLAAACEAQLRRSQAAGRLDRTLDCRLASYFVVSRLDNFGMAQGMVCEHGGYKLDQLVEVAARLLLSDLGLPPAE